MVEKRTEPAVKDGVWQAANACARCQKWFPPWMAGVHTDNTDDYCWGKPACPPLRGYLRASLFDGDESGSLTVEISLLLDQVVEAVTDYLKET